MKKNTSPIEEDHALEEALSPIVNRLIDKNYETSKDKIATQMAPLIGSAIREQIKSQKDDVVDALYPVMGNMISKYVTQSLEDFFNKINAQIQDGLSFATIKRKFKAKIKGVSETELLLNEMDISNVKAALLIHKETGIVLAHIENKEHTLNEPEMLGSMMTAIRSFVNDWVEQNNSSDELGEIDYGGNKIIIEASGFSYLAVIVHGATFASTYAKINEVMGNIVEKFSQDIRNFNGDLNSLDHEAIQKELVTLFDTQEKQENLLDKEEKKKKIHPLLIIVPLLLLGGIGYLFYKDYRHTQHQQNITQTLYNAPQLAAYRITPILSGTTLQLQGVVPFAYYKQAAEDLFKNDPAIEHIQNNIVVNNDVIDPFALSQNVAYLLKGFSTQEGVNLHYKLNGTQLSIYGSFSSEKQKKEFFKELHNIAAISKIIDHTTLTLPKIDVTIYFAKRATSLSQEAQTQLIAMAQKLRNVETTIPLHITIYSDMLGSKKHNIYLSNKRAEILKNYLENILNIDNPLQIQVTNTPPQGVDAKHYPQQARCATIRLQNEEKECK